MERRRTKGSGGPTEDDEGWVVGSVWHSALEAGTAIQRNQCVWEKVTLDQCESSHPPTVPGDAIGNGQIKRKELEK